MNGCGFVQTGEGAQMDSESARERDKRRANTQGKKARKGNKKKIE